MALLLSTPVVALQLGARASQQHSAPRFPSPSLLNCASSALFNNDASINGRRLLLAPNPVSRMSLPRMSLPPLRAVLLPVDPWAPGVDTQSIASSLFAASLFPYLGFLFFLTKSKSAPPITLFGFYFLLAFVGATIPAGIYAKIHYGTSLSNVDYLHGGAESLLTVTNLFIVLGLRDAMSQNGPSKEIEEGSSDKQPGSLSSDSEIHDKTKERSIQ